ncbi:MAG TPA: flagellar basal body-associated FliL family protein [Solirubrobacteraceae bacterium]|nr:flagellar basal body-associated FliL family protein [Solirubrobacteraceae bacterium]
MLKNKKVIIVLAVVIFGALAAYTMAKPKVVPKVKIASTIYLLPKDFLLNLSDGHFAKLTVGLELAPGQSTGATAEAAPVTGATVGTLPEEAVIRDIITNVVTDQRGNVLVSEAGRRQVKRELLEAIKKQTDVKVDAVLFPDLTVQ